MANFKIEKNGTLTKIEARKFKLEKDLQTLTEKNLEAILGLQFVRSEFALNNFRIDSLAFDNESKSFVIIEYKKNKNFSVIDQGYAYLSLMLNNKADFILEFNECCQETLKRNNVDWSQSKIIFISQAFTTYQKEAVNFKDLPIELWEVKRFKNSTISFNKYTTGKSKESIKTISRSDETIKSVSKEIEVFTEDNHIDKASDAIKELYIKLKTAIINLDEEIEINPTKLCIGFKSSGKTFTDIVIQNKGLKLFINLKSGELEDTLGLSRDVSNVGHWGNGDYEIQLSNDDRLEYILSLIKQSLVKNRTQL